MDKIKRFVKLQTSTGDPLTTGDLTITPVSQALIVQFPLGGFVWNRPVAVEVYDGEKTERIPIVDVTRIAQLSLIGFGLIFSVVALLFGRKTRS